MSRPVLTVAGSFHPFEIAAFLCVFMAGLGGLAVPGGQSNAVDMALPGWFVYAYYSLMTFWGAVALGSLTIGHQDTRMRVERIALYGIGYPTAGYFTAAFYAIGVGAWQAAWFSAVVPIGATVRIIQIGMERRRVRRASSDPKPADPPPLGKPEDAQ